MPCGSAGFLRRRLPADQDWGDNLMYRLFRRGRPSFFALIHLPGQDLHGFVRDDGNLLAHRARGDDRFPGDGRVIEPDELIGVRKFSIFLEQEV